MRLITHSGSFHADDVLAHAILRGVTEFRYAELVRTRDQAVFDAATAEDVIFDVGFEYDPSKNRFDHHQIDKPMREDGNPYSSVGLIWKHFGAKYLADEFPEIAAASKGGNDILTAVWKDIDQDIILETDRTDNGVGESFKASSFAVLIDDFNSTWDGSSAFEGYNFEEASKFAHSVMRRRVIQSFAKQRAMAIVKDALHSAVDPRLVILPQSMPWQDAVFHWRFAELLYVVFPRNGEWYLEAVPVEKGSFDQKQSLPKVWAGLRGDDLAKVTGVEDAIFCHAARFICGAKSEAGIMRLAELALADDPDEIQETEWV